MSTRCIIAKKTQGGKYKAIYSHWDGYPDKPGVGWTLRTYYKTPQKVNQLISKGDVSALRENIGRKHDFNDDMEVRKKGWSTFYGRDRGETDTKAKTFNSFSELVDYALESWAEYLYFYENGKWEYIDLEDPNTINTDRKVSTRPGWRTNYWGV